MLSGIFLLVCWFVELSLGKLIVTVFFSIFPPTTPPHLSFSYCLVLLGYCFFFTFNFLFLSVIIFGFALSYGKWGVSSRYPSHIPYPNSWCKPFTPHIPTREDPDGSHLRRMRRSLRTRFRRRTSADQEEVLYQFRLSEFHTKEWGRQDWRQLVLREAVNRSVIFILHRKCSFSKFYQSFVTKISQKLQICNNTFTEIQFAHIVFRKQLLLNTISSL